MKILHRIIFVVCLLGVSLIIAACNPTEPETIIKTVIVEKEGETIIETVVVTVEPPVATETETESGECCGIYRIGIFEEPISLNYWNYLGPGSSVWAQYLISDVAAHLFTLSDVRFQFVPSLAKEIPDPIQNPDGTWTIQVEMVDDAVWSDGEPITAHDVVFTHNACKNLKLTWYWLNVCEPNGVDVVAEASDDFVVKYTYLNQPPSLQTWQFGIAMAPILPEHYWADVVTQAYADIEDVQPPDAERPENCKTQVLSDQSRITCEAWNAYDQAYNDAHETLFQAEALDQPVAGGYLLKKWERGEYIQFTPNDRYYFKNADIVEFEDGTWLRSMPDGSKYQFYGDAEGEETLHYTVGPHNPETVFYIYGSQEAAFGALSAGEVDYVLNPINLPRDLREQFVENQDVKVYNNPANDMFYLAFNLRKYPMSAYEFRQVFDILIDKELVINEILGQAVIPLYSTMPEANIFWHNPDVETPYAGLTRAERVEMAVQVLRDAGWRWQSEPAWDENLQDVIPGVGLIMPNGQPMPELTILGPGPEFDIVRATFNQWISEWAREIGMPIQSELTGRNAILDSVFVAADFDMYIFGLPLGNPAFPQYYDEFWNSRNCTFETGGKNTPCYKNDEYDALVNEFMTTDDLVRARDLVYRMQTLLADERPYIPLYSEQVYDLARTTVVFPYIKTLGGIEFMDGFRNQAQVFIK